MEQQDALREVREELERMASYLDMVAKRTNGSPTLLRDVSFLLSSTSNEVKRAMESNPQALLH